jgi:hypothetical protein
VKIAYWDTEENRNGPPPKLLGEIKGTPTIRLYKPKKKQKTIGSNKEKVVVDYNYERKAVDMKRFVDAHIPDFVEKIKLGLSDLEKFEQKAAKYNLPRAMLFVSKNQTMPLTKYLSTEFRRKLLLAEIKPTRQNQEEIMSKYDIAEFPALIVFPVKQGNGDDENEPLETVVRYDGTGSGDFSRNKLHSFLSKYALKKIATTVPVVAKKEDEGGDKKNKEEPPKQEAVKEEL